MSHVISQAKALETEAHAWRPLSAVPNRRLTAAIGFSAAIVTAALILGSASPVLAADSGSKSSMVLADAPTNGTAGQNREVASVTPFSHNDGVRSSVQKPWPAPVGHRQPRVSDVSNNVRLSSSALEDRRLDRELDAKLIICRGC